MRPIPAPAPRNRGSDASIRRRFPDARPVHRLHLDDGRNQKFSATTSGADRGSPVATRAPEPRQRVERLMSEYFRHARIVSRSLEVGAKDRAGSRRSEPRTVSGWIRLSRSDPGGAESGILDWRVSGRHRQRHRRRGRNASCRAAACRPVSRGGFFPTAKDKLALVGLLKPRQGLYARLRDARTAGCWVVYSEFQAISWRVVRDLLPQDTSTSTRC